MVDLVRRSDAIRDAAVVGGAPSRTGPRSLSFFRSLNIWFWAIVGLPTLLAGVYFFAIASDLYFSEVKFLVRGPTSGGIWWNWPRRGPPVRATGTRLRRRLPR